MVYTVHVVMVMRLNLDWLSQSTQMHYNLIEACNVLHPNIIMQKFMINRDFLFENIDK